MSTVTIDSGMAVGLQVVTQTIEINAPNQVLITNVGGDPNAQTIRTYTAGEALSGHLWVVLNGSGNAVEASSQTLGHASRTIGMTTAAASNGAPVPVQFAHELVEPSWSWDPTLPIFIGPSGPTQTPPSPGAGDAFTQIAAWPYTATAIEIDLTSDPIIFTS